MLKATIKFPQPRVSNIQTKTFFSNNKPFINRTLNPSTHYLNNFFRLKSDTKITVPIIIKQTSPREAQKTIPPKKFISYFDISFNRRDRFQTALVVSDSRANAEVELYKGVAFCKNFLDAGFGGEAISALENVKEYTDNKLLIKIAELYLDICHKYFKNEVSQPFSDEQITTFNNLLKEVDRLNIVQMYTIFVDTMIEYPNKNEKLILLLTESLFKLADKVRLWSKEGEDKALELLDEALTLNKDYEPAQKLKIGILADRGQLPNGETFEFTDLPRNMY